MQDESSPTSSIRYLPSINFQEQFCHRSEHKNSSIEHRSRYALLITVRSKNESWQIYLDERQSSIERFHQRFTQSLKVDEHLTLDSFLLLRTLGQGGFGSVFLAYHKQTETYLALKAIDKAELVENHEERTIILERQYAFALDHPNIVKFMASFKDNEYVYIGLEWLPGGDLYSLMFACGKFTELQAKFYAAQMIMAIDYLHGCQLVYRDLKPENIVLTERGYIKLVDLGLAKLIRGYSRTFCGTPHYIAPEVIMHRPYTTSPDFWSLGIIIHEMVTGDAPYDRTHRVYSDSNDDESELMSASRSISTFDEYETSDWIRSSSRHYNMYLRIIHGCSIFNLRDLTDDCARLIRQLLQSNIEQRLGCGPAGAIDVMEHPWFSSIDFLHLYQQHYIAPYLPIRESFLQSANSTEHALKITGRNLYQTEFADF